MAGTKAEEDDEWEWGDFASTPNHTFHFHQINRKNSSIPTTATAAAADDDEWGDFVDFSLRSIAPSTTQWLTPKASELSDHSTEAPSQVEAVPKGVDLQKKNQWIKPTGALPLSIFGEEEVEGEDGSAVDPPVVESKDSSGAKDVGINAKNGANVKGNVGFNDIIATLYNSQLPDNADNGLNTSSNGLNLNSLDSDEFNSNADSSDGLGSNSDFALGNKDWDMLTSHKKANSEGGKGSIFNASELNASLSLINQSSLGSKSDFDIFTSLYNQSKPSKDEHDLKINPNASDLKSGALNAPSNGLSWNSELGGVKEESEGDDEDDDGWEFKDANSEWKFEDGNDEEHVSDLSGFEAQTTQSQETQQEPQSSELTTHPTVAGKGSNGPIDLFSTSNLLNINSAKVDFGFDFKLTSGQSDFISKNNAENMSNSLVDDSQVSFGGFSAVFPEGRSKSEVNNTPNGSIDLFAMSSGFSTEYHKMDFSFGFEPQSVSQNGYISHSFHRTEQTDGKNGLGSHPNVDVADDDESFGDFTAVFPEVGSKKDEPEVDDLSQSTAEELQVNGCDQGNKTRLQNGTGALPLSIFGGEEGETGDSFNNQDHFVHQPTSTSVPNNAHVQDSNVSIRDLISNLYSQAEQITSAHTMKKPADDGSESSDEVVTSNTVDEDEGFGDGSWEFKDAISPTLAENDTLDLGLGGAQNSCASLGLNNHLDFYYKLKDDLCFIARCHLDGLEKAQNTTAISGEDAKTCALDEEIQEIYKNLSQADVISKDGISEDNPPIDTCLDKFLEVLHAPMFQVLDSEYQLSRRLISAKKDLHSVVELMKHVEAMIKILTLGSPEEHSDYISAWSNMISVCAQELKHGVWIWEQSLERNIRSWIVSDMPGKRFILALAEIYRAVLVLSASAKLYKPWTLWKSADSAGLYSILEECHSMWNSGLEEALLSIQDSADLPYNISIKELLESIKSIHDLDPLELGSYIFAQQVSMCRLSLLSSGVLPGMELVIWNGEHYFLKLANLWANLVSCDPPNLPHMSVG